MLVFPDFRENSTVTDDLQVVAAPPALENDQSTAAANNPDLRAAQASLQQETSSVSSARSGLLPSVSFDYFYGIDANQFAIRNPDGDRLLGWVWQAQATVPLWNRGATQSKMRQAQLRRHKAPPALPLTQRQPPANARPPPPSAQAPGRGEG